MSRLIEAQSTAPAGEVQGQAVAEPRLPKRDFLILPLLSCLTLVLLGGMTEVACRMIWPEVEDSCAGHPNCTANAKFAEGPWVEYRYNECGYRNPASCGAKPPGTFRIVVLGSSIVNGWGVPYEQTFIGVASRGLSRLCDRKIEIQNISTINNVLEMYRHSDEAISLQPDLVILFFGAGDTHVKFDPRDLVNRDDPAYKPSSKVTMPLLRRIGGILIRHSRAMLVAKHFLYRNPSYALKAVVVHPLDVDYMVVPPPQQWKERLADLDLLIGGMADKFRGRAIPFFLVPNVNHPQALLLSSYPNLAGFDPRELEKEVEAIGIEHNVPVVNLYEDFAQAHSDLWFYSGDGHPNAEGHAVFGRGLARGLVAMGAIPGCQGQDKPKTAQ